MTEINFTGGLVVGFVVGVGLCVLALFMFGGLANAMGARSRMHKHTAWTAALRVLDYLWCHVREEDKYQVSMARGIMKTELERLK